MKLKTCNVFSFIERGIVVPQGYLKVLLRKAVVLKNSVLTFAVIKFPACLRKVVRRAKKARVNEADALLEPV